MMNRITLIGRLGRKPELRTFDSGSKVANFSIATSEYYRDKDNKLAEQTEWHDIALWGEKAAKIADTIDKGTLVLVEGKLTHRRYTDRDGVERTRTEVVADTVRSLERRTATSETPAAVEEPAEAPF
jgi:single-strand DNA-binding protein